MNKTIAILLLIALIAAVSVGLGWTAHQTTAAAEPPTFQVCAIWSVAISSGERLFVTTCRLEPVAAEAGMAGEQQL